MKLPFSSESFHFLVVKFSIYLNRRVFLMAHVGHVWSANSQFSCASTQSDQGLNCLLTESFATVEKKALTRLVHIHRLSGPSLLTCPRDLFILHHRIVAGYYLFTLMVCVSISLCLSIHPSIFCFRTIAWVNINGCAPNLVCALILWRSGLDC